MNDARVMCNSQKNKGVYHIDAEHMITLKSKYHFKMSTLMSLILGGSHQRFGRKNCQKWWFCEINWKILKKLKEVKQWSYTFCTLLVKRNNLSYTLPPSQGFFKKIVPSPCYYTSPTIRDMKVGILNFYTIGIKFHWWRSKLAFDIQWFV